MKKTFLQFGIAVLLTFILSSVSGTLNGQTCPVGMIGYWEMSENSGPNYYDSYSTHHAVAPSVSPAQTAGASGRAQAFSKDAGTFLTIADHNLFDWAATTSFSIELWVKFAGTTGDVQVFIGRDDRPYSLMQWWVGAEINGALSWYLQGSNGLFGIITSGSSYNDNQWHQVVAVRNGGSGLNYLYVDGTLQNPGGTSLAGFGTLSSTNAITIGNLVVSGAPDYYATCAIDEVAIYDHAMDALTEIIPHYNNIDQFQIGYCAGDDPMFLSDPIVRATVGQLYTYDVDASGNTKPTYSLIEKPSGMIINSNTGMITWTPMSQSANGRVVVRATNDKGSIEQDFNIFLADSPLCRPNMLAYWDFNLAGSPGYVDNIAGWELTGSAPTTTTGIAGSALNFNGVSDSLNLPDELGNSNIFFDFHDVPSFSIEFWMKSTASHIQNMVIVGRNEEENNTQYWLGVNPFGEVVFSLRDYHPTPNTAELNSGGNYLDGNWHHIVGSYNDNTGTVQLYVDKTMVDEVSESFLDFGGNASLNIGCLDNTPPERYWYEGVLDELAIYGVAMPQTLINESYDNALLGNNACVYNYGPVILSSPDSTVVEETLYTYKLVATDINEADVLSISVASAPPWLSGFIYTPGDSTATVSGTPGNEDVGMNTIIMRVYDGIVYVDQTFQVRVINTNDAPAFTSTPVASVDQNATYSYIALAVDPDGDPLTYSSSVKPPWLTFDAGTRELSGVPSNDDVGPNNVTLRASDGTLHDDQEFIITVNDVNDPPVFTSLPISQINQGALYSYNVTANDPDGDLLVYSAVQKPTWLNFNPATRVLSGTPGGLDIGFHNVTLRITDGSLEVDQIFQVEVVDINDSPDFISSPQLIVDQDANYSYTALATDPDGDPVSYSAVQLPSWLTFNPATRILSGSPKNSDVGTHDVTLRVTDGQLVTDQAFQITVNNINDLPVITSQPVTGAQIGHPYLYQINVDDPDPSDVLTFTISSGPAWMSLTSASSTALLTGTPAASDHGTVAVIIKVSDGTGDVAQGFSVKVWDPNDIEDADHLVNRIYPNPASDKVHFEFAEWGDVLLKLVDVKGSVVKAIQVKNTDELILDISDLSSNIYFYSVTINDKTSVGSLIKE
jgi:hypothetical protein